MKTFAIIGAALLAVAALRVSAAPSTNTISGWGEAIDPDKDCSVAAGVGKLFISLPGTDHALMPERGRTNAPRVMQAFTGAFDMQVKVSGEFPDGPKCVVPGRTAYQGAGLLVWLDEKNNLKLARAQSVMKGKTYQYFLLEFRHEGQRGWLQFGRDVPRIAPNGTVYLRLQIHKDATIASVSADGKKWVSQTLPGEIGPVKVHAGLIAENNTSSPLEVGFEDFRAFPSNL
jgi:regulation of enolase protein 1 (concanavalin A-like superfamily)